MMRKGPPAPVVRPKKLAEALSAIALAHGQECAGQEARKAVLQCLREANEKGRARAEAMLAEDGGGIVCASRISGLNDTLLVALHRFVVKHVYPVTNPTSSEHLAIVAVGGYGRGTLAPGSDIDLLFLLPYKQTPWGEQVVEYILYMLWDLGLKVGHSTRSIPECIRQARADMTVRTALLEARYICGRRPLFNRLTKTFDKEIVAGTGEEFVAHKLAERDERHRKAGKVRYLVEPDVKESKGGLRDLHTLFWIARYFYRVERRDDLVDRGVLSRRELRHFRKAEDFLWAVRCHLHFLTGKAEERLSFELQSEIAIRLGYTAHPGMRDVERFMKHYFLIAKNVGDLTRIFCAAVDAEQARQTTPMEKLFRSFSPKARKAIPGTLDFVIETGRIHIADDAVFERDPVNIVRMFHLADRNGLDFHPDALKRLTRSLKLVDDTLRQSPEANGLFIGILTSPRNPELILRRMNEAGVLGRFLPDFGRIVAMMQFNMYHHYTVDEHLLQSIGVLSKIEKGTEEDQHPLAQKLIGQIENRTVLYVALLLHDIAKGRPEDHSVAGAEVARNLCPRLGLSPAETETVAWLIEEHLTMSMVAQTRDLTDRKTIQDLADRVQTLERLKLLLILTVCDIRAVGPGVWNGWKGQLLRTLFYETELEITGGFSEVSRDQRVVEAQSALSASLEDWTDKEKQAYLDLHYPNYLLSVALDDQVYHAQFVRRSDADEKRFSSLARTDAFQAMTEIVILAADHPRLLSIIAGACAAAGANIVDAQIFTTKDGRALDVIVIGRAFETDEDELRRAARIGEMIEASLSGKAVVGEAIARRTTPRRAGAFDVKPAIRINNRLSNRFTVIEVEGLDRPGVLAGLTAALADLSLDIASAHISTFGEKIVDSFYVNDLTGAKITSANRQANIRTKLEAILADRGPANGEGFVGGILTSAAE